MARHSRRKKALNLWMNGVLVGTWSTNATGVDVLTYDKDWVDSHQGRPISLSLPFLPGNEAHRGDKVRFYFENLLPDNVEILKRIASRHKLDDTKAMSLLSEIGRDCVGAIQLLPDGIEPGPLAIDASDELSEHQIAAILRNTVAPSSLGGALEDDDFRISIAGAQEKTALLRLDDRWHVPLGATPTTHILKLPMGLIGGIRNIDMRHSVKNEWLCSLILRAYGLPAAECEPQTFEDITVLSVKRFDRTLTTQLRISNGQPVILRLPQEDMCQASGASPLKKYEQDGGPSMDAIMGLLNRSENAAQDKANFFKAQLVFWMLNATDGHAKNFSIFLRPGARFALTPLYDVLSASPIMGAGPNRLDPRAVKLAMAVRSKNPHWKMREIMHRHWAAFGRRHSVDAEGIMEDVIARTPQVIDEASSKLPAKFPSSISDPVFDGLLLAAKKLGVVASPAA